jgi:cytochrome c oxidase subunit 2
LKARALVAVLGAAGLGLAAPAWPQASGPVKTFEITASRFEYDPSVVEVEEGDEVRLLLRSADTTHGVEIKELKVKIKIPKGGASVPLTFKAARAGTFPITCSEYCGSGHRRMKARLVVTPRRAQ